MVNAMSQSRSRKASIVNTNSTDSRPAPKANGDSNNPQKTHQSHRSKSRNKIPKSVRFDLENALVGLCNVWFEDIKPHLLRNNIKVHVHGSEVVPGGAEGDLPADQHLVSPPGCCHLDPGAAPDYHRRQNVSFAGCCSTQRTASSARCRRRLIPRCPALPPLLSAPTSPRQIQNPYPNDEGDVPKQHVRRKASSRRLRRPPLPPPPPPPPPPPLPKLFRQEECLYRPYSDSIYTHAPDVTPTTQNLSKITTTAHEEDPSFPLKLSKRKSKKRRKMKDESTQTERQTSRPVVSMSRIRASLKTQRRQMLPPRRKPQTRTLHTDGSMLYSDDLINLIGEKHDKTLTMLYQSQREDYPLLMSLAQSPRGKRKTAKRAPWK